MAALAAVAELRLPDCWIGAGFVRDAVWDERHGQGPTLPFGDVDVLWFAPGVADKAADRDIERQLRSSMPDLPWSVKNQARMHRQNGDAPYHSVADAMMHWPETATAVAARLADGRMEISAPLGLDDLFALRVRPTAAFRLEKRGIFDKRIASKRWMERYPLLIVLDE